MSRRIFGKIQKIMLPKDYLAYRLSGSFARMYRMHLDAFDGCEESKMVGRNAKKICGITEEMLPKLYESYEVVGTC